MNNFSLDNSFQSIIVGDDSKCYEVNSLNASQQCAFVLNNTDCEYNGLLYSYLRLAYCDFGLDNRHWAVVIYVVILIMAFFALSVVADQFLCPSLMTIANKLKLSQSLAGVTILAFGNSAPDIFSSLNGIKQKKPQMVIGELFGAGIFITTIVAGWVLMTGQFQMMERPILRDIIFYLAAAYVTWLILWHGRIYLKHAIILLSIYFVYIVFVFVSSYIHSRNRTKSENNKNQVPAIAMTQLNEPSADPVTVLKVGGVLQRVKSFLKKLGNSSVSPEDNVVLNRFCQNGQLRAPRQSRVYSHAKQLLDSHLADVIQSRVEARKANNKPAPGNRNFLKQFSVTSLTSLMSLDAIVKTIDESKEFALTICPVDISQWPKQPWHKKIVEVMKAPAYFFMTLTIPVVDLDSPKNNWCRMLNCLHLVTVPQLILFFFGLLTKQCPFIEITFWLVFLALSILVAISVFLLTSPTHPPKLHFIFSIIGFTLSILTINAIANELIDILQAVGVIFNLSDAILGLTILAWGNSLGDLVSDVSMARQGYPRIGIAACFGGPLLNLLLGLGLPYTILIVDKPENDGMSIIYNRMITLLYTTITVSLVSSLVFFVANRFHAKKIHGIYCFCLYLVYVVFAVLIEVDIL